MKAMRYLMPVLAAAGAAAIAAAPLASADTELPTCTDVAGSAAAGDATTECATPGNVQLNASPSVTEPGYLYPWADDYYGPALMIGGWGGGGEGPHGGGGGGGGGHR
ncbi:hypothetical protein BH09ACT7_BH09ACT7_33620 [soil metagenome]